MSKKMKNKEMDRLMNQLEAEQIHLLGCKRGVLQLERSELEREDDVAARYRFGIYIDTPRRNYIVVDEDLVSRGVDCDDVLKSVAYDLLKSDNKESPYERLVNTLNDETDSFIYLRKTHDPDSWDYCTVSVDHIILTEIPDINARLIHEKVRPLLSSLLLDEPLDISALNTRLDELLINHKVE